MSAIKHKKANLVFPADAPMTNEELVKVIKEAEEGPFYTLDEINQAFNKWSKKYLNKEKLSSFAKELDAAVVPHNLSTIEIDALIMEAKK